MGTDAQLVYESIMAALVLYRQLAVEQREPTQEELMALVQRNEDFQASLKARIDARPG